MLNPRGAPPQHRTGRVPRACVFAAAWCLACASGLLYAGAPAASAAASRRFPAANSPAVETACASHPAAYAGDLLGGICGLRPRLARDGVQLGLYETSEVLGNLTGGTRRGFAYDGLTTLDLSMNTQRLLGWRGGTFNVSALQIHGSNLSATNLQTLQTASGIEAPRGTRLWELWYDQTFGAHGQDDLKLGQQSLDQEFMVSQNALLFVNTMFGWPMLPSADMPGGGPAYPLSAPGLRLRLRPRRGVALLAGVFNGTPLNNSGRNSSGLDFPVNGGALLIAELQYASSRAAAGSPPLRGEYKLGLWYDTRNFADQELASNGVSLASPASSGTALQHRGDWAWYGVADQMLWRDPRDAAHAVSVFARLMGTPWKNRNLIDFALNAGLTLREPFAGRVADTFGIGLGYTHVSARVAALDRDLARLTGAYVPAQDGETFIELTYAYQAARWLQLQPDVQYVSNPGGGLADPAAPGTRIGNEWVAGLRANVYF